MMKMMAMRKVRKKNAKWYTRMRVCTTVRSQREGLWGVGESRVSLTPTGSTWMIIAVHPLGLTQTHL